MALEQHASTNPATSDSTPATSARASRSRLWSHGLGRAGTRAAQILLVGGVVLAAVWVLSHLTSVTIPLMLALVFAAAFAPWMRWSHRHHVPPALGAALTLFILLSVLALALVFLNDQLRGFVTSADFKSGTLGGIGMISDLSAGPGLTLIILFFLLKDGPTMWEFIVRPFEGVSFDRAERIGPTTVEALDQAVRGPRLFFGDRHAIGCQTCR